MGDVRPNIPYSDTLSDEAIARSITIVWQHLKEIKNNTVDLDVAFHCEILKRNTEAVMQHLCNSCDDIELDHAAAIFEAIPALATNNAPNPISPLHTSTLAVPCHISDREHRETILKTCEELLQRS